MAASDFGSVLRYAEATLQHMPPDWRADLRSSDVAPHLAMLLAVTGYGLTGPREAVDLGEAALAALENDDPTRSLAGLIVGINLSLLGDPRATEAMRRAAAIAGAAGIASSEVEALSMLGLLEMIGGDNTAGCQTIEAARSAFSFHDLAEMTSTAGLLAIAQVAWTAFRGRADDTTRAIADLDRIRPALEALFPWYRPLAGAVCAFASVKAGDMAGFRRYVAWCDDSDGPANALCRQWAARARQEYASASPLQNLSPAELRVWEMLKGRMTLSEIAESLFLSRETVKSHTVSIYRKLGVASRREAQDLAESWS
jgi:LuxR family maltose regulon positive regulatory protein